MSNTDDLLAAAVDNPEPAPVCVVRIATSYWSDPRGIHIHKKITYLRRLSKGFNILEEDVSQIGAEGVINNAISLSNLPDGVYTVTTCNEKKDWETGYVDDYDYKFTPFQTVPGREIPLST